jgi:GLPGLI family protein
MKILLFLLFFLLNNIVFSQTKIAVEYQFTIRSQNSLNEYLIINDNESYYFGYGGIFDKFEKTDYNSMLLELEKTKKLGGVRMYFSKSEDLLFEYKIAIKPKALLAYEKIPTIEWKIVPEYKEFLGYKCQKATCKFRGRSYYVWFTKDIPVQEGPWKLKGLPGLILEASDYTNDYTYQAKSIIINPDLKLPLPQVEYFKKEMLNAKDLKEVIHLENKYLNDLVSEQMASYPTGTVFQNPPIRDASKEKTFEWEEPKKP